MAKKWMQKAFANSHGQFKAKAERAGETTREFAADHEHDSGKLGNQARLAEVGMAAHHHKSKSREDRMKSRYGG